MSDTLTYQKLVQRISSYAERSDIPFTTLVPNFISLAENRISTEVKGLGTNKIVEFVTSIGGDGVYAKPARWRETRSLMVKTSTDWQIIFPRTYEYCRMYQSGFGVPEFYCDYGNDHILMVNPPDAEYIIEWSYYERLAPLSDSNETNWLTSYQPNMLLSAAMVEACVFLKRADRQEVFENEYKKHVDLFMRENAGVMTDNSIRRTK